MTHTACMSCRGLTLGVVCLTKGCVLVISLLTVAPFVSHGVAVALCNCERRLCRSRSVQCSKALYLLCLLVPAGEGTKWPLWPTACWVAEQPLFKRAANFAALHRQLMAISLPCPFVEPTAELMGVFVSPVCQPAAVSVLITPLEHLPPIACPHRRWFLALMLGGVASVRYPSPMQMGCALPEVNCIAPNTCAPVNTRAGAEILCPRLRLADRDGSCSDQPYSLVCMAVFVPLKLPVRCVGLAFGALTVYPALTRELLRHTVVLLGVASTLCVSSRRSGPASSQPPTAVFTGVHILQ